MTLDEATRRLERWTHSLLDLVPRDRLIDRADADEVIAVDLDPVAIAAALAGGRTLGIVADAGDSDALAAGVVPVALDEDALARRACAIARTAQRAAAEGDHVTWLALGALWWSAGDVARVRRAPLLLMPVDVRRGAGGGFAFAAAGAVRFNRALLDAVRREAEVDVIDPDAALGEPIDVGAVFDHVTARIAELRPAWAVERAAYITTTSLAGVALWNDLTRAEMVARAPLFRRMLATDAPAALPEVTAPALPLDADAEQARVVGAALAGHSVAVLAPPGAGAMQTAANLTAAAIADGKTVLVVANRAAALRGVHRYLTTIGLGEFALALDPLADSVSLATALAATADRSWRPGAATLGAIDRRDQVAAALDDYAGALHAPTRSGITMHDAVARLIELRTSPRLAPTAIDLDGLDAFELARRRQVLADYTRAATAVAPIAAHPWRRSTLAELPVGQAQAETETETETAAAAATATPTATAAAADAATDAATDTDADAVTDPGLVAVDRIDALPAAATIEEAVTGAIAGTAGVAAALDAVAAASDELARRLTALTRLIPGLAPRTRADLDAAGKLFAIAARTPRPGADLIAAGPTPPIGEVTIDPRVALPASAIPRDPATYVALARRQRKLADELGQRWTPAIADLDLDGLVARFRSADGRSGTWRWFALRAARAEVRTVFAGDKLPDDLTIASDLETAAEERAARRLLGEAAGPARRWFGELAGVKDAADLPDLDALDLDEVDAALWWARELRAAFDAVPVDGSRDAAWRALVAQVCAPHVAIALKADAGADSSADAAFADAATVVETWTRSLATLAEVAQVDPIAIGGEGLSLAGRIPAAAGSESRAMGCADYLAALIDQVSIWRDAIAHLPAWTAYVRARTAAWSTGLVAVVAACESGELATDQAADAWERAFLLAVIGARLGVSPALAHFHGPSHHARAAELSDLTRAAQLAVRARAVARLAERVPRRSPGSIECEPIDRELARPAARAARELLLDVAGVMPRLAPCVLASPAAVAEHLDLARPPFDIVVILEAGAVPAATALGVLARGTTAVVLGVPGDDGTLFADAAARFPVIELVDHYRSRHEDLIAFTSKRWFGDRLRIAPAAAASPGRLGLEYRPIEGDPADAVVGAVLAHLRDPERARKSLAVIGFQRALVERIEDRLDAARELDQAIERACAGPDRADDRAEPIAIVEASLAQGIARDVTIVVLDGAAVGDPDLLTAITRAREQVIVMAPKDGYLPAAVTDAIPAPMDELITAPHPGAADMAAASLYLKEAPPRVIVASDAVPVLIEVARAAAERPIVDAAPPTPLCAAIGAALTARGWIVRYGIGTGPVRIDLAIVDPDDSGHYVLGIETDGPAYGAFAAAGDRDRLRGQLLTALGWRLHRVWCLDWWTDPEREAQRAHGAVISAIAAARQSRRVTQPRITPRWPRPDGDAGVGESGPAAVPGPIEIAAGSASGPRGARGSRPTPGARSPQLLLGLAGKMAPAIAPYQAAPVPNGRRRPDDMFEAKHADELGKLIDRVLEVEAPIHLGLLARRVGGYFGIGKPTPEMTAQLRAVLDGHGQFGPEPDVIWRLDQDPTAPIPVRVAADTIDSRRDIDEVPLAEIAGAAAVVVDRVHAVAVPDLIRDAARLLGFARITDRVIDRIKTGVAHATETGAIKIDGERATRP